MKINAQKFHFALFLILFFSSFVSIEERVNNDDLEPKKQRKTEKNFKICVISDLNSSYGSTTYSDDVKSVIEEIKLIKPDIVLCAGDMVAGQKSSLSQENIKNMWNGFNSTVLNPIYNLSVPFGFTVGNHDASPSYLLDRKLSQEFWLENKNKTNLNFIDSSNYPFYFSYTKDDIFFISWDAAGANISPDVYNWMESQLNIKQAKKAKLRILIGHLPLYAIVESKNKVGEVNSNPEKALNFFKKHKINLYISGHQHAYYPAIKNKIRFLNTGCIGDGPRKLIGSANEAVKTYTIIDVPQKRSVNFKYKTYDLRTKKEIDFNNLPDSIIGFNGISRKEFN